MADEERTDWTGIVARLRENEVLLQCINPSDAYFQTILALAEAERMVEPDSMCEAWTCMNCRGVNMIRTGSENFCSFCGSARRIPLEATP